MPSYLHGKNPERSPPGYSKRKRSVILVHLLCNLYCLLDNKGLLCLWRKTLPKSCPRTMEKGIPVTPLAFKSQEEGRKKKNTHAGRNTCEGHRPGTQEQ
jgi:hypothetical protein